MKKITFCFLLIIGVGLIVLFANLKHISSSIIQMKTLSLSQRLIPVFYLHPKDRIENYINNANDLFSLSEKLLIQDPKLALESALRAENSMTLMVGQLRRLQDTSIIPHALIFDTFRNQYSFNKNESIKAFMERNEKTAKMIYYNGVLPDVYVKY